MPLVQDQCLIGVENECLTVGPETEVFAVPTPPVHEFLERFREAAPSLRGISGIFNGYGLVYLDPTGHGEFASCECDSPFLLPTVIEQQQTLAIQTLEAMQRESGVELLLANNNYSGLYQPGRSPTWGTHVNYAVEQPPQDFTAAILPFLATRIYAGAGVIEYPTGRFLASVRAGYMEQDSGGSTTDHRALHSTARDEPHMDRDAGWHRYHSICSDGHQSHFNIALETGATALAIKAILFNPQLPQRLPPFCRDGSVPLWAKLYRELCVLAAPGDMPRVDPRVIAVQRVYWEGACEFVATRPNAPAWAGRLLADWDTTLRALEGGDYAWLAARLDAWAKHALFSHVLAEQGIAWKTLPEHSTSFAELTLLDQSYHALRRDSIFRLLEASGAVQHRVAPRLEPGGEPEPYVPDTTTRAAARARFIRRFAGRDELLLDWSYVLDSDAERKRNLSHPFAQNFSRWRSFEAFDDVRPPRSRLSRSRECVGLQRVTWHYDRGEYAVAVRYLQSPEFEALGDQAASLQRFRLEAWCRARAGLGGAIEVLDRVRPNRPDDLSLINDYVVSYRHQGLRPAAEVQAWLDRGTARLEDPQRRPDAHWCRVAFAEHKAHCLLRQGQAAAAEALLRPLLPVLRSDSVETRVKGRLLATLGDIQRVQGRRLSAVRLLERARRSLALHGHYGEQTDAAWTNLAKAAATAEEAHDWWRRIIESQTLAGNHLGLVRTLLLQARRCHDPIRACENQLRASALAEDLPALASCPLWREINERWEAWIGEPEAGAPLDLYWGM